MIALGFCLHACMCCLSLFLFSWCPKLNFDPCVMCQSHSLRVVWSAIFLSPSDPALCYAHSSSLFSKPFWSRWLDRLAVVLLAVLNTELLCACDSWVFVCVLGGKGVEGGVGGLVFVLLHALAPFLVVGCYISSLCNDLFYLMLFTYHFKVTRSLK